LTPSSPTRIAVIGSGPAGFYAAGHLLADSGGLIEVDMFERLPTPWGLVRSGVAPDHPKIKSVTRVYEKTAAHPRFRYFGNVEFGTDVTRAELVQHYSAIVYATGSLSDRPLGIPGEELPGSWAATDFVGWYNAHPDYPDLEFDVSCGRAVVVGNGNVALDVARMLMLSHAELAKTDIADHALELLEHNRIREVVIVGRRGPAQASFTNPELRELDDLEDVDVIVDPAELEHALATPDPNMDPTAERNVKLLREYAANAQAAALSGAGDADITASEAGGHSASEDGHGPAPAKQTAQGATNPRASRRRVVLRFLLSPIELRGDEHGVREVVLVRNELQADHSGALKAVPTREIEVIPAGLVFRAIGYRGAPLPEIPFDERRCVIPNEHGRVLDPDSATARPGEYVVGWIKRGPTGVIGTNKKDAQETVDALLEDLAAGVLPDPLLPDPADVEAMLRNRKPDLVTYADWDEIDRHERRRGEPHERPRVKLASITEMLEVAAKQRPSDDEEVRARDITSRADA
jgi:ferredoxin/flavodoxin---NADP+ reductase